VRVHGIEVFSNAEINTYFRRAVFDGAVEAVFGDGSGAFDRAIEGAVEGAAGDAVESAFGASAGVLDRAVDGLVGADNIGTAFSALPI